MLENRSFDHMLGFLYTAEGNVSPSGAAFDGLTGKESNPDQNGNPVLVSQATSSRPNLYFLPGADPGEGYAATNSQLFGAVGPSGTADQRRLRHELFLHAGMGIARPQLVGPARDGGR